MKTEREIKTLKIGDKIYNEQYGTITGLYIIDRLSNTMAFSKNTKFKLEISNYNTVKRVGDSTWGSGTYFIATPEIEEKFFRQQTIYKIKNFNFSTLTTDEIRIIKNIISKSN